jgi:tetratricopeptide (TPR) repeat protein
VYKAKEYFKVLTKQNIVEVLSQGIEGKIALLEKDYKKASKLLAKFYNENPLSKNALLLNKALQGNNKNSAAIELLEFHLENNEKDNNVRLVLANNYIGSSPGKAISAYKRILVDHPNSLMVLNNVAWLSMEQGDLEDALAFSESAYKIDSNNVNVIDTKAMILFKLDRKGEALRNLGTAHDLSEGKNIGVALNYAEVLIASNRNQSAIKILDAIETSDKTELNRIRTLKALAK